MKFPPLRKSAVLLGTMFFFSPLAAFPLIWVEIYNRKKYAIVLLAFFLAMCAYIFVPAGDLYRHRLLYLSYMDGEWTDVFSSWNLDYLVYLLSFGYAKLGLNDAFVRFTLVLWCALLYFNITYELFSRESSKRAFLGLFLLSFLLFPYFTLVTGLRFGAAVVFFWASVFFLFHKKEKKKGYFYLLLSVLSHFSMWGVVPFMWLARKNIIGSQKILFIVCGVIALGNSLFINYLNPFLGDGIYNKMLAYTMGEDYIDSVSPLLRFIFIFPRFLLLPLGYYLVVKAPSSPSRSLAYNLLFLLCLFYPYATVFGRYTLVCILVAFLCYSLDRNRNFFRLGILFLLFAVPAYFSGILAYYRPLAASGYYSLLYTPYPCMFGHTYEQGWVDDHINSEGGMQ